jgi:hypothetical protein
MCDDVAVETFPLHFAAFLDGCLAEGLTLPLHIFVVASNGEVMMFRLEQQPSAPGLIPKSLWQSRADAVFTVPMVFVAVGANVQIATLLITQPRDATPALHLVH